jgi:hypothetical protein
MKRRARKKSLAAAARKQGQRRVAVVLGEQQANATVTARAGAAGVSARGDLLDRAQGVRVNRLLHGGFRHAEASAKVWRLFTSGRAVAVARRCAPRVERHRATFVARAGRTMAGGTMMNRALRAEALVERFMHASENHFHLAVKPNLWWVLRQTLRYSRDDSSGDDPTDARPNTLHHGASV